MDLTSHVQHNLALHPFSCILICRNLYLVIYHVLPVCGLQPAEWMISGTLGALAVVAAAVVRIYLGWAYVGNRLLSAAVEYEETGW